MIAPPTVRRSAPIPVVLVVRKGCPFCAIAEQRVRQLCDEDRRVVMTVRDADEGNLNEVVATPVLLLPNGKRLTGTPTAERLHSVVERYFGASTDMSNKAWYLERNRLFRGVPAAEIEKFAHLFREADYGAGQVIFHEGDLGDAIYLLKTGHVRLYRLTEDGREATLALLGPGDVFGELALFEETERTTIAEVVDDAHICAASVGEFTTLMAHKPQLTMMVAREIARRRQEAETRFAGTAFATVRGRVIQVLRHLATEHGEPVASDGGVRILVRLTHQQIASFAGASREACSTELSRLQRAGLLRLDESHHFIIPNLERLKPGAVDALVRFALKGAL